MAEENLTSALFRRHEQLKRWHESDTNKCSDVPVGKPKRVKFQDGCVFLAACSSGDREEVKRLLDRGADINTANIDGLTALHQACIDDNLDMVEFLVENEADVDVCDNEGWTPLHATASCGFTEIARYLLRNNANVAAVNNDGDLPYDICEEDEMEKLLQEAMDEQGVDADAARREEEEQMMADANQWLNNKTVKEQTHPKTGATALHVASAKGYVKVMNILLQAGVDMNAKDNDGWTALHAAAHWGQEEACKILAENMCDMESKNLAGQTAFDVADTETIKLLEELKLKQASLKDQQKDSQKDIIQTKVPSSRRRSSVTRMSVEQKHNVMKIVEPERITLDPKIVEKEEEKIKSSSSSASDEETSESETEKKNEINKQTSDLNKPRDRDKPPIMTTVEIKEIKPDIPIINDTKDTPENIKNLVGKDNGLTNENEVIGDSLEKDKVVIKVSTPDELVGTVKKNRSDSEKEEEVLEKEKLKKEIIKDEKIKDEKIEEKQDENEDKENKELVKTNKELVKTDKEKEIDTTTEIIIKDSLKEKDNLKDKEKQEKDNLKDKEKQDKVNDDDKEKNKQLIENVPAKKDREPIQRTISAPPTIDEVPSTVIPKISINSKPAREGDTDIPSWRSGLRKTGSTSTVLDKINEDDKNLPRSASSPRLAEENKKNEQNDKPLPRRPFLSSSSFSSADHNNSSITERYGGSQQGLSNPYRYSSSSNPSSNYHSSYVPFYKLQQMRNETKEKERAEREKKERDSVPITSVSSRIEHPSSISNRITAPATLPVTSATTTTGSTISTTSTTPTTITTPTSSFVHFRKSYEPPKRDEETEMLRKKRAKRARETRRSTQGVTLDEVKQASEELRKSDSTSTVDKAKDSEEKTSSTQERSLSDISETVKDTNTSAKDRLSVTGDSGLSRTSSTDISSSVSNWRRSREEREENNKKDDDTRSSFRRSRDIKDLSNSAPSSSFYSTDSTYIPRSQRTDRPERNALSVHEPGNTSLSSSGNLTRSTSLRTPRIRNDEIEDSTLDIRRDREKDRGIKEGEKTEKDEKRPESSAMRTRRMRRERRSTGIANYTAENDEDKDKENKEEEHKTETDEKSSRVDRYGSASDVPSHLSDRTTRPSSYTEYSRSTPSLDKDYKKLYEEEKSEKERLKRDLEYCKKELREAKLELDRQMKRSDANRVSETNDKRERRALERKLSELEEEIKLMEKLRADNAKLKEENRALTRVVAKLSK